jgi:hypothetical protein
MSTVLLIFLLSIAFLAILKAADTFRDMLFEIRQTRAVIEHQTHQLQELHREWRNWSQAEPMERPEASRRRMASTANEIVENLG